MEKIIYDIGANNGDDLAYYLKKADVVVACEADPDLCEYISNKFQKEITDNRLIVENFVISEGIESERVPFYKHKTANILNQFPKPSQDKMHEFEEIYLPAKSASSVVKKYGNPYYIKIDVEFYDQAILRDLFNNKIQPEYISAESHNIEVFCILVVLGEYKNFKLVDGQSVSDIYRNHSISTNNGMIEEVTFPHHSAGPFGDDIIGDWMDQNNFINILVSQKLGWKDIHAKKIVDSIFVL